MITKRSTRTLATLAAASAMLASGEGCAHRRQSYSGGDLGPSSGVHVRAPFVDVYVPKKAKVEGERISRHDEDDDRDDDDRD